MWTTPEKHTKKRETLGNANQNKPTRWAGYKKVYDPPPPPPPHSPEAFRIKGALWNAELNKNADYNSQVEEGQRKSLKMNQSNWKGALQKPLWEAQSPTKC